MNNLFGSLDLTNIGKLVKEEKLSSTFVRQDGTKTLHLGINIVFNRDAQGNICANEKGVIGNIFASCPKDKQKDGVSYFVASLRESTAGERETTKEEADELPF